MAASAGGLFLSLIEYLCLSGKPNECPCKVCSCLMIQSSAQVVAGISVYGDLGEVLPGVSIERHSVLQDCLLCVHAAVLLLCVLCEQHCTMLACRIGRPASLPLFLD